MGDETFSKASMRECTRMYLTFWGRGHGMRHGNTGNWSSAREANEHEHSGYFVKIPECLSGEREREREEGSKEAELPLRKMVTSLIDQPHARMLRNSTSERRRGHSHSLALSLNWFVVG